MNRPALATTAAAAVLALTGCSGHSGAEEDFLANMDRNAPDLVAHFDDDERVLLMGDTVCNAFDEGWTLDQLWTELETGNLTVDNDAATMIGAAVGELCPRHADRLGG